MALPTLGRKAMPKQKGKAMPKREVAVPMRNVVKTAVPRPPLPQRRKAGAR